MSRTVNQVLLDSLADQKGELILRVLTWTDQAAYNAAPTVPEHTWVVKKFDLFSTSANAELVTENDYTASAFSVFIIERGATIAGVEYTVQSGLFFVQSYTEHYGVIKISGSSYPNQKISIAAGDGTYQEVTEAFCTAIGKNAVFKNSTDAWLAYQFLPTGKALSLNKAELFESLLKQKYTILVYEESPNNLVFYNQDSYPSSALKAITYDGSAKVVAVTTAGSSKALSSLNGTDWIPQTAPAFANDIVYAPTLGLYVAVGVSICHTSPDGVTWTARAIPTGTYNSITFGNSIFVAVGTNVCATSTDGITWTSRNIGTGTWLSVSWSSGLSIFMAHTTTLRTTSTDGITWTVNPLASYAWTQRTTASTVGYYAIAWSPALGMFAAIARAGANRVQTSTDGTTWTPRTAAEANSWSGIVWAPALGMFAAVALDGANRVMTSTDGITWTARTAGVVEAWTSIAWSPSLGLFVAVGLNGKCQSSPDGITWTTRTGTSATGLNAIAWSPELGIFVAVGAGGKCMTSTDGITWTARTTPEANNWQSVIWSPAQTIFVAVSSDGTNRVMTSPEGATWTSRQAAQAITWKGVSWSPEAEIFTAVAEDGTNPVMTSTDGFTWTTRTQGLSQLWQAVTWSPALGMFAAVGSLANNIMMTWTIPAGATDQLASTSNASLFIIVGISKCYTSTDAVTWTSRTIPAGTYYGITYGNSLYLAVGANVIATSADGITWTARTPANTNTLRDAIYALGLFIALASDGLNRIQTSADGVTWTAKAANADFELSYLDGVTSYLDRQQSEVHFIWQDEVSTVHTSGDTTLPQWNLGFLASTNSPPATREDPYYKIFLQKALVRLDITDGDKIHFTPYWSIDPTKTIDAMIQVSEHFHTPPKHNTPAWYQEIKSIVLFDKTEGGALPSTIERVAAYTPLVSTGFDANLTPAVNNLQALAQAVDDLPLISANTPATTAANDFQVGNGTGAWIKKTLAEIKTILGTPATTAANDFQVGNGAGAWIKKTLAEIKTILGLGSVADFTPIVAGTGTAGTGTYSSQIGKGEQRGDKYFFILNVIWSAISGSPTGFLCVQGLPVAAANNGLYPPCVLNWNNITLAAVGNKLMAAVVPNTTQINLYEIASGSIVQLPIDTAGTLTISGWYFT